MEEFFFPGDFFKNNCEKSYLKDLATPDAFHSNPGLVWEFYHYRREVVRRRCPNAGHIALAHAEKQYTECGRSFFVITQNVDGLHTKAGSVNVLELHGMSKRINGSFSSEYFLSCYHCLHLIKEYVAIVDFFLQKFTCSIILI